MVYAILTQLFLYFYIVIHTSHVLILLYKERQRRIYQMIEVRMIKLFSRSMKF